MAWEVFWDFGAFPAGLVLLLDLDFDPDFFPSFAFPSFFFPSFLSFFELDWERLWSAVSALAWLWDLDLDLFLMARISSGILSLNPP